MTNNSITLNNARNRWMKTDNFKSLTDGRTSYTDCGADSSDKVNKNHNLPHRIFYPIEIIKPKWVSVDEMNLPKQLVKITNI